MRCPLDYIGLKVDACPASIGVVPFVVQTGAGVYLSGRHPEAVTNAEIGALVMNNRLALITPSHEVLSLQERASFLFRCPALNLSAFVVGRLWEQAFRSHGVSLPSADATYYSMDLFGGSGREEGVVFFVLEQHVQGLPMLILRWAESRAGELSPMSYPLLELIIRKSTSVTALAGVYEYLQTRLDADGLERLSKLLSVQCGVQAELFKSPEWRFNMISQIKPLKFPQIRRTE